MQQAETQNYLAKGNYLGMIRIGLNGTYSVSACLCNKAKQSIVNQQFIHLNLRNVMSSVRMQKYAINVCAATRYHFIDKSTK